MTLSGTHLDAIYSLDWSNDGAIIATGSADKTVCPERNLKCCNEADVITCKVALWDPKAARVLKVLQGHTDTVCDDFVVLRSLKFALPLPLFD